MLNMVPQNYLDLEEELEISIGRDRLNEALNRLEGEYGSNGMDLYHAGELDLLIDIVERI